MHRGFSLLELMFVLLVMTGILIASYQRYETYKAKQDIASVEQNVQLLFYQLNSFYANIATPPCKECSDKDGNPISNTLCDIDHRSIASEVSNEKMGDYWPKQLLKSNIIDTKYGKDGYAVSAVSTYARDDKCDNITPCYLFAHMVLVKAKLNNTANIAWYATRLSASCEDKSNNTVQCTDQTADHLIWSRRPTTNPSTTNDNLWILSSSLQIAKRAMSNPNSICK
jgi:prepilin-type N-terminal cleavage/methylation domain-containing protein